MIYVDKFFNRKRVRKTRGGEAKDSSDVDNFERGDSNDDIELPRMSQMIQYTRNTDVSESTDHMNILDGEGASFSPGLY